MKKNRERKTTNNKLSIIGFYLGVTSVLCVLWDLFAIFGVIGLVISIVGLLESLKNKDKLFYPVAGTFLTAIFSFKILVSAFIYLESSYNNMIGTFAIFACIVGLISLIIGIYYKRNDRTKKTFSISSIVVGIILLLTFLISFLGVSDTKNRLEFKLKEYAKEYFETDNWMRGNIKPDTYSITLNDLSKKLKRDIKIFEKYKCDPNNTRVEFVVHPQLKKGQTNYTYNIILDCDI